MKKFALLITALSLCCGCTDSVFLTKQDSGKNIELSVGEKVTVKLAENPNTGYGWEFFTEPENQDIIGDIKEEYVQDKAENGMVGVGGVKSYSFIVQKSGEVVLKGYYFRPWENKDTDSAETVNYKISVH